MGNNSYLFFIGHDIVKLHNGPDNFGNRHIDDVQSHGAGLRFRNIHQGIEHGQDPLGFFHTVGQGFIPGIGIMLILHGQFRHPAQAGHGRA